MRRAQFRIFFVLFLNSLFALIAATASGSAGAAKASFATVGAETKVPYGWMDFCTRQPQECDQPVLSPVNLTLTRSAWSALIRINREVNAAIEPISNFDHWGTIVDHWDYPTDGKGDCKIYALQKRRLLMEKGFPRQALLMTIVRDKNDMGHTILTVRTDRGDFILDNLTDDVLAWNATGYRFVKRQSQEDPNVWLSILAAPKDRAEAVSATSFNGAGVAPGAYGEAMIAHQP